jgi:putative transposase
LLRVPYKKSTLKPVSRNNVCALDPGMRTFQTVYTPQENCFKICTEKTNKQIYSIIERIENPNKENPNYKKYLNRLREKLKNKISDLHWKTCNFLCKNFDIICVGNMSTKSIISNTLNIAKVTKKYCITLSHFLFKKRLQEKCIQYECSYREIDESYTSKTCGGCGNLDDDLGNKRTYNCSCSFNCDRDVNGARNILIKYLCN